MLSLQQAFMTKID